LTQIKVGKTAPRKMPPPLRVAIMATHFDFLNKPLAKEIAVILLIKLALLMGIRSLWFDAPAPRTVDGAKVGQHMLGPVPLSSEKPKND
jgi:hypothetical protein